MTVRAVDMQTMIPRLNEASKLQHQAEQQPQLAQHAQTLVAQARTERAQHQVNAKIPVEHATLDKDGRGPGGGGGQPRARKDGKESGGKEARTVEPGLGHRLDVKV